MTGLNFLYLNLFLNEKSKKLIDNLILILFLNTTLKPVNQQCIKQLTISITLHQNNLNFLIYLIRDDKKTLTLY